MKRTRKKIDSDALIAAAEGRGGGKPPDEDDDEKAPGVPQDATAPVATDVLAAYNTESLRLIGEAQENVSAAWEAWEEAHEIAGRKRKDHTAAQEALVLLIIERRRGYADVAAGQLALPFAGVLPDAREISPPAPETNPVALVEANLLWRETPTWRLKYHGLNEAVVNLLEEAGIMNLGVLTDNSARDLLVNVPGIDAKAADKIEAALAAFQDWRTTNGIGAQQPTPDRPPVAEGEDLFVCNNCNTPRSGMIHPCPNCGCPEYRIETATAETMIA